MKNLTTKEKFIIRAILYFHFMESRGTKGFKEVITNLISENKKGLPGLNDILKAMEWHFPHDKNEMEEFFMGLQDKMGQLDMLAWELLKSEESKS